MHCAMEFQRSVLPGTWRNFPFADQLKRRELRHTGTLPCRKPSVFSRFLQKHQAPKSQMSLSSFGNFSASGAATLRTPDCSSALGLYVPSVCLFFFTTQNSQARTAKTMARTPRVTVGATIAAMLGPVVLLLECVSLAGMV